MSTELIEQMTTKKSTFNTNQEEQYRSRKLTMTQTLPHGD